MIQEVTTGAKALAARKYTKWHQTHYKESLFTATYTLCFWFWGYEVTYPASNKERPICYIRGSPTESLGHLHLRAATAALRMHFHLPAQYNEQWFTGPSSCLVILSFFVVKRLPSVFSSHSLLPGVHGWWRRK